MAGNRVTLRDIAKRLSLSMPTVSRALADHPDISSATKERVRDVAQSLNYIPNYRARYLRAKHSRLIALILPEMNMFFVPSMITGINRVVQLNDYSLIVFQSDNSIVQERRLVEYCTHLSADGVLLVLSSETTDLSHLTMLRDCGIPVVLLDKTIETTKYSTVTIDDHGAGREAAMYLIEHGHCQSIGVFGDQRQRISSQRPRDFAAGIRRNVSVADSQILRVTILSELEEQLDRALAAHPDVTAIFAMTDELLVHTHYLLMRRGMKIPDDGSLLAISDGQAPTFLHPNVTTSVLPGWEAGERTASILVGMIEPQLRCANRRSHSHDARGAGFRRHSHRSRSEALNACAAANAANSLGPRVRRGAGGVMQATEYDAIVVGSGIAGGWAAKELTEKGLRVLLLERGRNIEHIKDYVNATKAPWDYPHAVGAPRRMERHYPCSARISAQREAPRLLVKDDESPSRRPAFRWFRGYNVGGAAGCVDVRVIVQRSRFHGERSRGARHRLAHPLRRHLVVV